MRRILRQATLGLAVVLALAIAGAQDRQPAGSAPASDKSQDNIPDAPSATRPPGSLPAPPPSAHPFPEDSQPSQPGAPAPNIGEAPEGSASPADTGSRDELFKIVANANFVQVPVTVKDPAGHLVEGLGPKDFRVLEDGNQEKLAFFTSDPFPLSAAVVVDLSLPEVMVKKVQETLPALVGAFGQFDEVSVYSYGSSVQQVQDFTPTTTERLSQSVKRLRTMTGRTGGVPVVGGPFGSGPSINGLPVDRGQQPNVQTYRPESHVLNDAILQAAMDLSKRDKTRRRILFVISDGRELGSGASYAEVLKVLLSYQISVYAVGVALPGYSTAQRVRVPGLGYGDILPKYAAATGGEVMPEFSQDAIEKAYSQITEQARNQYTLGYMARSTPSSSYRTIEVQVVGHGTDLSVHARDGYYPLPPKSR